jgi:hypothetical protein
MPNVCRAAFDNKRQLAGPAIHAPDYGMQCGAVWAGVPPRIRIAVASGVKVRLAGVPWPSY